MGARDFIAYVKMDGSWYQCDDDRITLLEIELSLLCPFAEELFVSTIKRSFQ